MYGFASKEIAEANRADLASRYPQNRYEVAAHRYSDGLGLWQSSVTPMTWGVMEYVPYCDAMPERCTGFVWFDRVTRNVRG